MDVKTVTAFYGVLAIVGIVFIAWFALMTVAGFFSDGVRDGFAALRARLRPAALTAAWAAAALAMAGSLYFSEYVHYTPCTLCWYQRIAMYPLVLILGIAAWRKDLGIRLYAIPLAAIGAAVSTYHYALEWFPELDYGACTAGIPCTQVWFREFGFISLPFLALIAFLLVITFLLLPGRERQEEELDEDETEADFTD
jgi:disulfide bond formation protein DsbB